MKQKLSITVRGKQREWNFNIDADPKYLQEWRDDGLECKRYGYGMVLEVC